MYSGKSTRALPRVGFPIRTSRDQRLVSTSPRLFAAAHVLHRLLAPRHPPCALRLLIMKNTCVCCYGVFKVHVGQAHTGENRPEGRSLKTQQRADSSGARLGPALVLPRRGRRRSRRARARTSLRLRGSTIWNPLSTGPSRRAERPTGVSAPISLERR